MGGQTGWFYRRPVMATILITLSATVALTTLVWWAVGGVWSWVPWVLCWLGVINLTTPLTYGFDKRQALKEGWRVPEATLFLLALLGGSPGAFLAMRWFRHKSVKGSFRILYWLIVVAQLVLLIWIAKNQWLK